MTNQREERGQQSIQRKAKIARIRGKGISKEDERTQEPSQEGRRSQEFAQRVKREDIQRSDEEVGSEIEGNR